MPTSQPRSARASARFRLTVDLPTPPLPLVTATVTTARIVGRGWRRVSYETPVASEGARLPYAASLPPGDLGQLVHVHRDRIARPRAHHPDGRPAGDRLGVPRRADGRPRSPRQARPRRLACVRSWTDQQRSA